MTSSGDLNNKHTFLSRVFGLNSTYNSPGSNPLLNDDNDDLQLSIHNLHDNFEEDVEDDDEDDDGDSETDEIAANNQNSSTNPYTGFENDLLLHPQPRLAPSQLGTDASNKGQRQQKQGTLVNVNSEDENSSDSDSASDSDPRLGQSSQDGLLYDQKRQLLEQVRSEFTDDEDFDTVPESLLMERIHHKNSRHQPPRSILNNKSQHQHQKRADKPQFFEQLMEAERSITPSLSQLGEKAKDIANRTINSIPKSIPKRISFQLPNNTSSRLPPPPISYRRDDSTPQTSERNTNEQRQLRGRLGLLSPMERALWLWSNISNLDQFLEDVYTYYIGNGYKCIILSRVFDLLIIVFVVTLTSYMGNCIDYHKLMNENVSKLSEVTVEKCYSKISFSQKFFYFLLFIILTLRVKTFYDHFKDLREIKNFYNLLLGVGDYELQTISWSTIVKKIMILRDQNTNALISGNQNLKGADDLKSKTRLSAHDIANRLMRKENYMIAIFNKNILNSALTIPILNSHFLTKTLEWNLKLCIFDFVFNTNGQLKQSVLNEHKRLALSVELRKRFRLAGILSIFLTPFLVIYFLLYFFLKFFYDFKTNPSLMSSREYSPYARWKLREFNELPHIFTRRLKLSRQGATEYIDKFPKEATNIVLNFISFITGSLVAILVLLTVLGHENFLNFELMEGRTVLFYISTLGAVFTISKGSVSENDTVFDPEASLRYVAQFTHYLPSSWNGRFHTEDVKNEFCGMFNLRIVLILREIASLIMLPYILYYQMPEVSEKVIDFFREFSVHVDGLGYVCTFAMFSFDNNKDKPVNMYSPQGDELKQDYYSSGDDKMVKSYLFFLESYGNEPVRQAQNGHVSGNSNGLRPPKHNGMSKSLLKSAVLNNSMMERKTSGGISSVRYPPQFKHTNITDSVYSRPNAQNNDLMEDTTAGLGADTRNYLSNLNNSTLLGESFQHGYPIEDLLKNDVENHKRGSVKNLEGDEDDEDDDNDGDDEAGVLGLINQIYKNKGGVR